MRIAVFAMDTPESVALVRPVIRLLRRIGASPVLVQHWTKDLVPVDDLADLGVPHLPITDGAFDTIPRLSEAQYAELGGSDIDILRCQFHSLMTEGLPLTRATLDPESPRHQRWRGFAWRIECLLRAMAPDVVIVQQGSEPVSRLVVAVSRRLGVPLALLESSFVPGTILLDSEGMHFYPGENRIEGRWRSAAPGRLDPVAARRLESFLAGVRERGLSKYAQPEDSAEVARLAAFAAGRRGLVFLPDQLPWDASVVNGLQAFESFRDFVDTTVASLPEGFGLVYKVHPRNPAAAEVGTGPASPDVLVVRDVSIHRLFQTCAVVCTFSSNVGFEALMAGKPVVVGGRPHYARRGLTLDVEWRADLGPMLERAPSFRPDPDLRARFIHHVLFDYLIDGEDASALRQRLEEARNHRPPAGGIRAPFLRDVPPRFQDFVDLASAWGDLARRNFMEDEILEALRSRADLAPGLVGRVEVGAPALESGERQVAVEIDAVAPDHLLRYGLAAALVSGRRVLDFACGTGYGSWLLAGSGARHVTGMDGCREAVEFARATWDDPAIAFVAGSAGSGEFPERSFDAVVSLETVEHVADGAALLERAFRALAPGGLLIFSVPDADRVPLGDHPFHVRHLSRLGVRRLIEGLPDVASFRLLGQDGGRVIDARTEGRHVVAIVEKGGAADAGALGRTIDAILPFTSLPALPDRRPVLRFPAERFRTQGGAAADGAIVAGDALADCHVVYGPYVKLRPGSCVARFRIEIEGGIRPEQGQILLEVARGGGQVLRRVTLGPREVASLPESGGRYPVPFGHGDAGEPLEFRVYLRGRPLAGRLVFRGVDLERLEQVRSAADPPAVPAAARS